MDKVYLIKPTLKYKEDAINYIREHIVYGSNINGSGGLDRYYDNYESWLKKLEEDEKTIPNENRVPSVTYFLVRESDDLIIGMINIRLVLNDRLKDLGGNIGYGIRPTERRKGYAKEMLYLGLLKCNEFGIDAVQVDCDKLNIGSKKTIEALYGNRNKEFYSQELNCEVLSYIIDVNKAIEKYKGK